MTLAVLVPLEVSGIGESDIVYLQKVLAIDEGGHSVEDILRLAGEGKCRVWRLVGGANGVLVTQLNQLPAGLECIIWFMAGVGILKCKDSITQQLEAYARQQGARWIVGRVTRKGLMKYYEALGMGYRAVIMGREL